MLDFVPEWMKLASAIITMLLSIWGGIDVIRRIWRCGNSPKIDEDTFID